MSEPRTLSRKIVIASSEGDFTAWEDGTVIGRDMPDMHSDILQMDFDEWRNFWQRELPDTIDILDVGYWYEGDGTREYEPPAESWRQLGKEGRCPECGYTAPISVWDDNGAEACQCPSCGAIAGYDLWTSSSP